MSGLAQNRQIKTSPIFKKIFSKRCNNSDSPTVYRIETVDNREKLTVERNTYHEKAFGLYRNRSHAAEPCRLLAERKAHRQARSARADRNSRQQERTGGNRRNRKRSAPESVDGYDSKDAAAQAAGFDLAVPDEISGCSEKSYRVLSAEGDVMFEIIYASGEDETARIRKAPGADDVSGDYNEYAETETVDAGGVSVTMKGENGLVKLAIWTNGDYSYVLSVESGLSQNDMATLVSNIQ